MERGFLSFNAKLDLAPSTVAAAQAGEKSGMSAATIRAVTVGLLLVCGCGDKPGGAPIGPAAADNGVESGDVAGELPSPDVLSPEPDATADEAQPPDALPPDTDAAAEMAADSAADADVETQPPVPLTDCATPTLKLKASHKTLIPPPVPVALSASATAGDVSAGCTWSAGPPQVCEVLPGGKLRKKGDGTCIAMCTLTDGRCGQVSLVAKKQDVIYVVGGKAPKDKAHGAQIVRLRTADGEWDDNVATLPERRRMPSVLARDGKLFVAGGYTSGSKQEQQFDPDNFPKCPEAITFEGGEQGGCLAIRQLDLGNGTWSDFGDLPTNGWEMGATLVGDRWYLTGGTLTPAIYDTGSYARVYVDFGDGSINEIKTKLAPGCSSISVGSGVAWQGNLVSFDSTSVCQAVLDANQPQLLSWKPVDIGWPCATGPARMVFSVPGPVPNLFVLPSIKQGPGCPPQTGAAGSDLSMAPQRYLEGKWSDFNAMSLIKPAVVAMGQKTVYLLYNEIAFNTLKAVLPVLALDSVDGPVKLLPPMPYWRFAFAAAVIEQ